MVIVHIKQVPIKLIYATVSQNSYLMKHNCILHQENLYAKALKMGNITKIIIKEEIYSGQEIKSSPISRIPKKC